jgi:hypothetical protein
MKIIIIIIIIIIIMLHIKINFRVLCIWKNNFSEELFRGQKWLRI